SIAVLLGIVGGLLWLLWPFWELVGQFGGRPDQRPSRIYAAAITVEVGQRLDGEALANHLDAMGYRVGFQSSLRPGEYRRQENTLGIFVRSHPNVRGEAPARPVEIDLEGGRVRGLRVAGLDSEWMELDPPLLTSVYGPDRRERRPVRLEEVSEDLVLSVLASEDARYFEHGGVSVLGILRAMLANVRSGSISQGGSTLTQQLAKNLFLTHERTVARKAREAVLAVLVDLRYSKREILEAYLNEIYLGGAGSANIMGVGAASWAYFGCQPSELTLAEAATLAGLIPAPARYSPLSHPEAAKRRRDLVLGRLEELEWVTPERIAAARQEPLEVRPQLASGRVAPYFVDALAREAKERFGIEGLADGGYTLLSTLSLEDQAAAEASVAWGLKSLEEGWEKGRDGNGPLQSALVSLDPRSGAIRAYVGGRDYGQSQYDRAGVARRQVGSAFKPIVYAAAFGQGAATPASLFDDAPLTLVSAGKHWSPENSDGKYRGQVSVRTILRKSLNVPTVRVAMTTRLPVIVDLAAAMGISPKPAAVPSIALGAVEASPVELATVYSVLASGGNRPTPYGLLGGLTPEGLPMASLPTTVEPALDPAVAYLVTTLLQDVMDRGTGSKAREMGLKDPVAGKTGTTNDRRDSWFAGYSPDRVTVVWVGYDENASTRLSGSRAALPIWTKFTYAVRPPGGFQGFVRPAGLVEALIDPASGGLASSRCPDVVRELFLEAHPPRELCFLHRGFGSRALIQPEGVEPEETQGRFREWLDRVFGGEHRDPD
ncbi:MAG: PBP1A family penicillin-binding protein, partial [Thermoanaerobaculia bacterium]|nr:PBP1A family penicillin-binding protein [Thermoanaerobaculia bacterium]